MVTCELSQQKTRKSVCVPSSPQLSAELGAGLIGPRGELTRFLALELRVGFGSRRLFDLVNDPDREGPPGPDHVAVDSGVEGAVGRLSRAAARPEPELALVAERRVGWVLGRVEALR